MQIYVHRGVSVPLVNTSKENHRSNIAASRLTTNKIDLTHKFNRLPKRQICVFWVVNICGWFCFPIEISGGADKNPPIHPQVDPAVYSLAYPPPYPSLSPNLPRSPSPSLSPSQSHGLSQSLSPSLAVDACGKLGQPYKNRHVFCKKTYLSLYGTLPRCWIRLQRALSTW